MPTHVPRPARVHAAGNKAKSIDEYVGPIATGDHAVTVAHMRGPGGWSEPGQTPEFDEYTVVLVGRLQVRSPSGVLDVTAGQAVTAHAGEWVSTPPPTRRAPSTSPCASPAFSPATVHRDDG